MPPASFPFKFQNFFSSTVSARGGGPSHSRRTWGHLGREAGAPRQGDTWPWLASGVTGERPRLSPCPAGSRDTGSPSPWATEGDPKHFKCLFEHRVCSLPPSEEGGPGARSRSTEARAGPGPPPPAPSARQRGSVCRRRPRDHPLRQTLWVLWPPSALQPQRWGPSRATPRLPPWFPQPGALGPVTTDAAGTVGGQGCVPATLCSQK